MFSDFRREINLVLVCDITNLVSGITNLVSQFLSTESKDGESPITGSKEHLKDQCRCQQDAFPKEEGRAVPYHNSCLRYYVGWEPLAPGWGF